MKEITYFVWNVCCIEIDRVTLSVLENFNAKFNAIPIYRVNVFYGAEKVWKVVCRKLSLLIFMFMVYLKLSIILNFTAISGVRFNLDIQLSSRIFSFCHYQINKHIIDKGYIYLKMA